MDTSHIIKKLRPWSYSKLSTLKQCPYLFFNSYITKSRPRGLNVHTLHGNVAHDFLDKVFKKELEIGEYFWFVEEQEIPSFVKEKLLGQLSEVESLYNSVINLIESNIKLVGNKRKANSELKIYLDNNLKRTKDYNEAIFMAVIDLIAVDDDTILLIDYKSTAKNPEAFKAQMDFYAFVISNVLPGNRLIKGYIAELKTGELTQVLHTSTKYAREKMTLDLFKDLKKLLDPVENLSKNYFLPKTSNACKWCYLNKSCPEFVS